MTYGVKRKLVQSTESDPPYPLRKKRKTEAKTIQELCNPTLTDIRLGESDNQQIFKSNDPTKFSLNQEYNFAKNDWLKKTDEHESDNWRQNSSDHDSDDSSADRRLTESSDWDSNSSCSSDYSCFLEGGSLLMDLEIPLTKNEENLIDQFCEEMKKVEEENNKESALERKESALERIKSIVDEYLKKGIRLNACYGERRKTVTNLVFEEVMDVTLNEGMSPINRIDHSDCDKEVLSNKSKDIMRGIIGSLLLEGGKVKESNFSNGELGHVTCDDNYVNNFFATCEKNENDLKNVAYESIVNKNKQTQKDKLKVEIDNGCFCIKYPQDSTVEVAKVLSNEKNKGLNLRVGILQIGKSIVRAESYNGKRNYLDVLKQGVILSFDSEAGKISIHLNPKEDSNEIEVKLDKESEARLNALEDKRENLGESCLLGGKSVWEAIRDGKFEGDSISKESTSVIEQPNAATNTSQSYLEDNFISLDENNHKTKEQDICSEKWQDRVIR